jgi:Fe-S cluster assembly protein SufB
MRRSNTRRCRTGIPATKNGVGGIYNFVTKRGECKGPNSKISWTQVETGSAITWKYPSCMLLGDNSSASSTRWRDRTTMQQADTGTKMIHIGEHAQHDRLQGHLGGRGQNSYRGLVKIRKSATARATSRSATRC